MEFDVEQPAEILQALDDALLSGYKWMALSESKAIASVHDLTFFETTRSAADFCERQSTFSTDWITGEYLDHIYRYLVIEQFKRELVGHIPKNYTEMDQSEAEHLMKSHKIRPHFTEKEQDLKAFLLSGNYFPVWHTRTINPRTDISRFHIIEHRHDGGMIYELGHSHKLLGSHQNFEEARREMLLLVDRPINLREQLNYHLVGQFKGQKLVLDMEGEPIQGSGLIFVMVSNHFDTEKYANVAMWREIRSVSEIQTVNQELLAKFDPYEKKFSFFDEKLDTIRLGQWVGPIHADFMMSRLFTIKNTIMNESNFKFLKDQVKYTGFGETLENDLKTKMIEGAPEFYLTYKPKFGREDLEAALHFKQSEKGNYYFNSYDLMMKDQGVDMKQTFRVTNSVKLAVEVSGEPVEKNYNNTFNLKEAFNLMEGRSVNKDIYQLHKVEKEGKPALEPNGKVNNTWITLNFKETDDDGNFKKIHRKEDYKFDLESALGEHPIKELNNKQDKEDLLRSLKKGNRQSVTFVIAGENQKRYIQADPQYRSIRITENSPSLKETAGQGQSQDKNAKQEIGNGEATQEDTPTQEKKKRPRKSRGISS